MSAYESPDPDRTYAGSIYDTPSQALAAAYLDFVTAGGANPDEDALAYAAADEIESCLREAAAAGWTWPGEPTEADFRAAAAKARIRLRDRIG